MIISVNGITPQIHPEAFIAPTATIIGNVEVMAGASVWFGAVLRGDIEAIKIGQNSNVQDNCTIHTDVNLPAIIGDNVTIGHNAVIHGCNIEGNCLIGMGAVILNGAKIKFGSIIAAGSVVKVQHEIGPQQLAAGIPASVKKNLDKSDIQKTLQNAASYLELMRLYNEK